VPARASRLSGPQIWLVSWILFCVLGGLWALSSPILSVPDESSHAGYAAAAVRGQIWAPADGTRTTVTLPGTYENIHDVTGCYLLDPNEPAGCAEAFTAQDGEAEVITLAGRYIPAYYMYSGLGSLVADGAHAIYAMRLLTVALVAAFLASAVCSVLARPRPALGLVGLGLAATPMLFFFAGAVNPQAPEIAAAILLWTAGAGLLRRLREEPDLPLTFGNADLRRVLISLITLPLIRPLALLWLAIAVVALLLAFGSWSAIRRLLTSRAVLLTLPVFALAVGTNLFWVLVRGALMEGDSLSVYANLPLGDATQLSVAKLDEEYWQMIGVFGWLSTPAPGLVYVVFSLLLGGLLVLAALQSPARQNLVLAAVVLAVVAVPVLSELASYDTIPFGWQGRYTLPIAVGVPLLLAASDGAATVTARMTDRFLLTVAAGMVVVHSLSFMGALNRHVFGISGFWFISPHGWAPPLPASWLVIGAALVSVVGAGLAYRAGSGRDEGPDPADRSVVDGPDDAVQVDDAPQVDDAALARTPDGMVPATSPHARATRHHPAADRRADARVH
jgi:hypothetical protein